MKTKNITANGEFVFIRNNVNSCFPHPQDFLIDFKEPFKIIGYCSEIIKDEELAKRVVERKIVFNMTSNKSVVRYLYYTDKYNIQAKATESFASLLQANDIDLELGDWLVIKKV